MIGSAFIKDGELNLRFEWLAISGKLEKVEYELGTPLLDFIWMDDGMIDGAFQMVLEAFLSSYKTFPDLDGLLEYMGRYVREALKRNIYFYLYQSAFVGTMGTGMFDQEKAMEILREYLLDDSELVNIQSSDWKGFAVAACSVLTTDIKHRKKLLLDDLKIISGENNEYKSHSPLQRMYLLILGGKNYLAGEFNTTLLPDFAFEEDANFKAIKKVIEAKNINIVEMTNINTLNDLIRFELFHTIKDKLTIKKCGFCGGYFIPRGRSDMEYCNRIKFGEEKRCNEIGAFRKRAKLVENTPAHKLYVAALKRMSKRRNTGGISEDEYRAWSFPAIEMRDKCLNGEITKKEFEKWLDENSRLHSKRDK